MITRPFKQRNLDLRASYPILVAQDRLKSQISITFVRIPQTSAQVSIFKYLVHHLEALSFTIQPTTTCPVFMLFV